MTTSAALAPRPGPKRTALRDQRFEGSRDAHGSLTATARARPSVFVGSSGEGLPIAQAVQVLLDRACEVEVLSQGVFGLTQGTLKSLVLARLA